MVEPTEQRVAEPRGENFAANNYLWTGNKNVSGLGKKKVEYWKGMWSGFNGDEWCLEEKGAWCYSKLGKLEWMSEFSEWNKEQQCIKEICFYRGFQVFTVY